MAQARFSVRTAVAEGFDFWRTNWLKAIGPLAIAAAAYAFYATRSVPLAIIGGAAAHYLARVVAEAALYRVALSDLGAEPATRNGPFGLQWGLLETRLVGVLLLKALLFGIVLIISGFLLFVLLAAFAAGSPAPQGATFEAMVASMTPQARGIFALVLLVALVGILILWARLSMAAPATAAENRVQVFSSLRLTRGSTGKIVAVRLLVELPVFVLQVLAGSFGTITGNPASGLFAQVIVGVIGVFFFVPIIVGATAYVYRCLRTPEGVA